MLKISVIVLVLFYIKNSVSIQNKIEKVYVHQKQQISDQDNTASASGYMYRSDGHGPATYVDLGGHPQQKYGLVQVPTKYYPQPQPQKYYQPEYLPEPQPQVIYQQPQEQYIAPAPQVIYQKPVAQYSNYILPKPVPFVEGSTGEEFKKGGGEQFNAEHFSKQGEKGEKGYKSKHDYEKGQKGHHGNEHHKGYYDENAGHKAGHSDSGAYYDEGHQAAKAAKGENFHESKGHKKGSKTTGFHNVYHKDEYKKDHTFYDEADVRGHHEKYGDEGAHHSSAAGGFKKGGSHDSAFLEKENGKQGHYDKGHNDQAHKGYKGQSGQEEYYSDLEAYKKNNEQSDGKEYGYKESDGKYY
ncbi:homeotic protein proboscipedia-like [Chrysoperla carnea]|uniref:homeotic protein proboscipedia-like n=1 Tax=Chrysoperla carnea TaxID=189513 RepID=UPI001D09024B|nr:homeotic protein proboscipedia-like [Chrysoperla carnea]